MIYYDERIKVNNEEILMKRYEKVRHISKKDAFKLYVISKFLEKPAVFKVNENIDGIHYRYGIPVVSERFISRYEKRDKYFIFKGGKYYKIDSIKLIRGLREKGMTVSEFCRKVGISKRNFYNYLRGQMVREEVYGKIREILGDVSEKDPKNIFEVKEIKFKLEIHEDMKDIYEQFKKKFETYILNNNFVDFCLKGNKRVVIKVGYVDEDVFEIASRELESFGYIVENKEEAKILLRQII